MFNFLYLQETLENVKKCKNFLVTLMKLASSGTRSTNMAQNVKALVKSLLVCLLLLLKTKYYNALCFKGLLISSLHVGWETRGRGVY